MIPGGCALSSSAPPMIDRNLDRARSQGKMPLNLHPSMEAEAVAAAAASAAAASADPSPFNRSMEEASADRLPTDILQTIQRSLPLVDHLRFPAVCTAWRSASRDRQNLSHLPRGAPWLFTVSRSGTTLIAIDCLSNIGAPKVYRFPLPEHLHGHDLFASIGHRLLLEERCSLSGIRLFDPFSPSSTQLDRLPPSASLLRTNTSRRSRCHIHAVVTDTNSGITVALLSDWILNPPRLAYTRFDCNHDDSDNCSWIDLTHLMPDPGIRFQTALLYKDGLFCAVDDTGTHVLALDFSSAPAVRLADMTLNLPNNYSDADNFSHYPGLVFDWCCYQSATLVNSGSSLFLVRWRTTLKKDVAEKGRGIDVYRLDDGIKEWVPVKSLGDRSFFIGHHNQSISISTMDFPELKTNRVYLHGDPTKRIAGDRRTCPYCSDDTDGDLHEYHLVYNLGDESWQPFLHCDVIHDCHSPNAVWMIPRAV